MILPISASDSVIPKRTCKKQSFTTNFDKNSKDKVEPFRIAVVSVALTLLGVMAAGFVKDKSKYRGIR